MGDFKTKVLEPVSSSPQSRHLKVPFGIIESVELVDDNHLNVRNCAGDMVLLQYDTSCLLEWMIKTPR